MTQIIVLPHLELCPEGAVIEATPGKSLCDSLLANGIDIEHACEKSCACTTCHVSHFEALGACTKCHADSQSFHHGTARVDYRGAQWDAVIADPNQGSAPGEYKIVAIRGSTLVLAPLQQGA